MHELILIDYTSKQEIGRRAMAPAERYGFYAVCANHELLTHDSKCYRVHTVAWRIPEEDCCLAVTFDSWEPSYCDC